MSKTITTARIRADGKIVRISKSGKELPFPHKPMRRMTETQVRAAANADPDARPMTSAESRKAKPIPHVKTLRRALGLSQEEFAVRYQIPLGTLRDWEQGRAVPDKPARTYLKLIALDPERVRSLLNPNM